MQESHSRSENNKVVRTQNVETVISLIQRNEQVTTDLLVKHSGLSYPTVFGIVRELLEAGIVERQGYADSTGGRQAHLYSLCAGCAYTFGLHITGSQISIALTNLKGGMIYQHQAAFSGAVSELPGQILSLLELALEQVRLPKEKLLAACICTSQTMRRELEQGPLDVRDVLHRFLDVPVELVLDSAVQGFLDWETFSCSGMPSFLHIVFGDSIRAARYLRTEAPVELPGSLSHITMVPNGAECRCGKHGCLETYYNGAELLRRYELARAQHGMAPLTEDEYQSKGLFRWLLSRSLTQDVCAEAVLPQATEMLAVMVVNLISVMDEYHVVLSGLYSSNDTRNFQALRAAVERLLSEEERMRLDLSMGLALPAESALGASRLMNSRYACRIGRRMEIKKRRNSQ